MKLPYSQKAILIKHLYEIYNACSDKNFAWIKAYDLRGKETTHGFSGHQADRRLRELAKEGRIEHRINGKFAEYRYKELPKQTQESRLKQLIQGGLI